MTDFQPVFTDAGRAAAANDSGDGLKTTIKHIVVGDAKYAIRDDKGQPLPAALSATKLKNELLRLPVYAGGSVSPGSILLIAKITAALKGEPTFWLREVGFVDDDGVLIALWSDESQTLGFRNDLAAWNLSLGLSWTDLPPDQFKVAVADALTSEQLLNQARLKDQVAEFVSQSGVEYDDADKAALNAAFITRIKSAIDDIDKKIRTPIAVSPAAGATGVVLSPRLQGNKFNSPDGFAHIASQFRVVDAAGDAVYDSGEIGAVEHNDVTPGKLTTVKSYRWQYRYKGKLGETELWSDYSELAGFETANTFIRTPTILTPVAGAAEIGPALEIVLSAFAVENGVDAQSGIRVQIARDSAFTNMLWDSGVVDGTADRLAVPDGKLPEGEIELHVRGQYIGKTLGAADWAPAVSITTKQLFAYITKPTVVAPAAGATGIALQPVLTGNAYVPIPAGHDVQDKIQFQVASDAGFTDLVWDSGVLATTDVAVQVGQPLDLASNYRWRYRQHGTKLGWGGWSDEAGFTTRRVDLPQHVFSAVLYDGNANSQTINGGIDLLNHDGLAWLKNRSTHGSHSLFDTRRGGDSVLKTNSLNAAETNSGYGVEFTEKGMALDTNYLAVNAAGSEYVARFFRKSPRFFDVVEFVGDGSVDRPIAHSLQCEVGAFVVKNLDESNQAYWHFWHRSVSARDNSGYRGLKLSSAQALSTFYLGDPDPTEKEFFVTSDTNKQGVRYIAYLWAHDPGADGIIQCDSYIGSAPAVHAGIDTGWPLASLLCKNTEAGLNWCMYDAARHQDSNVDPSLSPNTDINEVNVPLDFLSNGFRPGPSIEVNGTGQKHVYIAIRAPIPV